MSLSSKSGDMNERTKLNPRIIPMDITSSLSMSGSQPSNENTPFFIHVSSNSSSNDNSISNSIRNGKVAWKIFVAILLSSFTIIILWMIAKKYFIFSNHSSDLDYTDPNQLDDLGFDMSDILLKPFSSENPINYRIYPIERSEDSKPGDVLLIAKNEYRTLPTNAWCENLLLGSGTTENNHVYQIPYVVDAAGPIPGLRTHPVRAKASAREVMMIFEPNNALTLGTVEPLNPVYKVVGDGQKVIGRLVLALDWYPSEGINSNSNGNGNNSNVPYKMQGQIARGSPYMSAIYDHSTPAIRAESSLIHAPIIDGLLNGARLSCGDQPGVFSEHSVRANKHIQLRFHASDMTWMVFFSEPVDLVCSSTALEELSEIPPFFELRATKPLTKGMVRIALVNNCTTGTNPRYCEFAKARDGEAYKNLIIEHADVYPTVNADIGLLYPSQNRKSATDPEEYIVKLNWNPSIMSALANDGTVFESGRPDLYGPTMLIPETELLMMSVVHHRKLMTSIIGSSNSILEDSSLCTPTLHGFACPVLGNSWALKDTLYPASFFGTNTKPKPEMMDDLKRVLKEDIKYSIPYNYRRGAGDTYFSGKMLAKLGRILVIDEGLGKVLPRSTFNDGVTRLRQAVEVWLNGSAVSPFLYDAAWGGVLSCGCDYNYETTLCNNIYPNCPGVSNMNMNFGFGYYNDHHFHLGYHIYAAAVVAKYDPDWGKQFYQQVMFLIRDIANPSPDDPYFVSFRHMDWYLGFSWAGGIVELGGQPYLNGRNWESSSEAISAYEGVALYGHVMATIFHNDMSKIQSQGNLVGSTTATTTTTKEQLYNTAKEYYATSLRVKTVGRILMSMTVRAAKTYYHVQSPGTNGTVRVYPDVFAGKAVGMMWSLMMEQQTWFGNEAWKSYGIQVLPLTAVTEQRDDKAWLEEMLPLYKESCDLTPVCSAQGWSVPIYASYARFGRWEEAWKGINNLTDDVFYTAGGNGHSRINSLWFIATWNEHMT